VFTLAREADLVVKPVPVSHGRRKQRRYCLSGTQFGSPQSIGAIELQTTLEKPSAFPRAANAAVIWIMDYVSHGEPRASVTAIVKADGQPELIRYPAASPHCEHRRPTILFAADGVDPHLKSHDCRRRRGRRLQQT
jgi:hypothetical protein